jgi:hypothetical protein
MPDGVMVPPNIGERFMLIYRALTRPIWYSVTSNALNVAPVSGTITTVATVTTLTNQAQVGGVDAKTAYVDQIMRANWNNGIRRGVS